MRPKLHHRICARPIAICWAIGASVLWILVTKVLWDERVIPSALADVSGILLLLVAYACLVGFGFWSGVIPLYLPVSWACRRINGGPFAIGDRVIILTGRNAGITATVCDFTQGQAGKLLPRVELGDEARGKRVDIYDDFTLLRVSNRPPID